MACPIKPLGDRVVLEICEKAEEMKGGILIPDSAKEKPQEYKVIALGTGKTDDTGVVIGGVKGGAGDLLCGYHSVIALNHREKTLIDLQTVVRDLIRRCTGAPRHVGHGPVGGLAAGQNGGDEHKYTDKDSKCFSHGPFSSQY